MESVNYKIETNIKLKILKQDESLKERSEKVEKVIQEMVDRFLSKPENKKMLMNFILEYEIYGTKRKVLQCGICGKKDAIVCLKCAPYINK